MSAAVVPDSRSDALTAAIAGPAKVSAEPEKVAAFVNGGTIFPTTLELDLGTACNRTCPECPSTTAPVQSSLTRPFLEWLFATLDGRTPGLLLTGGEPTMAPLFPEALALARRRGFAEIAVVTNGGCLDRPAVIEALLAHATTIRVSLYDWNGRPGVDGAAATLRRIEALRELIDRSGSRLRIGASALTSARRVPFLSGLARAVERAGAHWLYFHPLCSKWGQGAPELDDQAGVLAAIAAIAAGATNGFRAGVCHERYAHQELAFSGYHAAHFLMVVGADGLSYLAPEVKYQAEHVVADLNPLPRDPLAARDRLARIAAVRSDEYPAKGSRHRGILYSDWLQARLDGVPSGHQPEFMFPYIL